jgi:hypothetical protein
MAIFSKKNSGKRSEEKATVILDESLGGKPVEDSPVKESSASETEAKETTASPSVVTEPAKAAEPAAVAKEPGETDPEDVEPESLTPPVAPMEHRFGIDDAIQLMRSLPSDPNSALVVRVVRVTLGAVNVSVEEIVADATRKEDRIKESISVLEARIVELDGQLGALRREIAAHQADLKETVNVREKLHMADQYPGPKPPPTPIAATLARLTQTKPISS